MALRTRIDETTCTDCGGPCLVVEHRMHSQQEWREVERSCLRRCHRERSELEQAS